MANDDNYYSLERLYNLLSPAGLRTDVKDPKIKVLPVRQEIQNAIMDPRGVFHSYDEIHKIVSDKFKKATPTEKEELKYEFHAVGPTAPGLIDFGDKDYWGDVTSISSVVPQIDNPKQISTSDFAASAFIIRDPYVSPSTRGVDAINFFMNYTPPVVASLMMPYLDVEFELRRTYPGDVISTPTLMRFLLGSRHNSKEKRTASDYAIEKAGTVPHFSKKSEERYATSFSGMEMFLMPQTLTNMLPGQGVYSTDGFSAVKYRKPFLPFASVESLDVSAQNAGAGKFAHRKGTLKLKIHDKARLTEFSDFLRPQGYHQALIWTTYGWIAPMNNGDQDEYSKFINDNMLVRECWSVVNTSFGFDSSGQVQLSLELMSRGGKMMQGLFVGTPGQGNLTSNLEQFHRAIEGVSEFVKHHSGDNRFAFSALSTQVLNSAATTGMFGDLDNSQVLGAVKNIINSLKSSGFDEKEVEKLKQNLDTLTVTYSFENIRSSVKTDVTKVFNSFGNDNVPDPFLPSANNKAVLDPDYWGVHLAEAVAAFSKTVEARKKAKKELEQKATQKGASKEVKENLKNLMSIDDKATVVSFGKLFLTFVLPVIKEKHDCDEVQVYFYQLNDQCGPLSGHSVAEFPIDVMPLAQAYAETLKTAMVDKLSIETFLKLVIETQFTDQRAIGYGMYRFFKPFEADKPRGTAEHVEGKEKEAAELGLSEWFGKWGSWRPPMIEMTIETGEEGMSPVSPVANLKRSASKENVDLQSIEPSRRKRIIKRIHIYDKQCNPYRLLQSIVAAGEGKFQLGGIDKTKLDSRVKSVVKKMTQEQREKLNNLLASGNGYIKALREVGIPGEDINGIDVIERPQKDKQVFKTSPAVVKDQLQRFHPTIKIGANGTMVTSANVSSKTDGLQGAINIMRSAKGFSSGKPATTLDGLADSNGLPLTIVPVQLNMSTLGIPTLQLYQHFFVDFDTGTTIDNVYACSQIQHNITPGKFISNLTFIYTPGYAQFGNPTSLNKMAIEQLKQELKDVESAAAAKKGNGQKKK